jgi:UMF1 family MFS transporter
MKLFRTSREVFSWSLYDWANSTYSTVVITAFFPVFFQKYWSIGTDSTVTTARLGTLISAAGLLVAVISPFLGALADLRGQKKRFTFLFMLLGALSSAALAFVGAGEWMWAAFFYALGTTGFNASCTFYDSLLPSIAPGAKANYASSLGYALGYLGGGVMLTLNVFMTLKPAWFGLASPEQAVQVSFVLVALWWAVFSLPLFRNVPEPPVAPTEKGWMHAFGGAWAQLKGTLSEIKNDRNLMLFVLAFWLYIDGVYTVINMAVDFGISLGFASSDLITAVLLVQFVGFPFALLFSKLASMWGSRVPILLCLVFYSFTLWGAMNMSQPWHFYVLAAVIGMVQGGVQALSRSLFSRMVPPEKSGEYFGFFNLIGKFASILGPLLVGWGTFLFGDHRKGLLGILVLFFFGGAFLWKVKEPGDGP